MIITLPSSLVGMCEVTVKSPRGDRVLGRFPNLIRDYGLLKYRDGSPNSCAASSNAAPPITGTGTPLNVLGTASAADSTSALEQAASADNGWVAIQSRTWTFSLGAVVGNVAKVYLYTSNSVFVEALIRDTTGAPTVISILADEQLIFKHLLYCTYPSEETLVASPVLNGTTHKVYSGYRYVGSSGSDSYGNLCRYRTGSGSSGVFAYEAGLLSLPLPDVHVAGVTQLGTANSSVTDPVMTLPIGNERTINLVRSASTVSSARFRIDPPVVKDADSIFTFSFSHTLTRGELDV